MQVFIWEALTAGVLGTECPSLLREGRSMLAALAANILTIEDCCVTTILHERLDPLPISAGKRLQVECVGGPEQERFAFNQLAKTCDRTWIVAPEIDGVLWRRIESVESAGGRIVGPTSAAARLCGDKLALAQHLATRGISTIETWDASDFAPESRSANYPFPCVIKPRFGAGSLGCRRVDSADHWQRLKATADLRECIMQPFVAGETLSVSAIVRDDFITTFPVGRQLLSDDGRFSYRGGSVGGGHRCQAAAEDLIRDVCRAVDGLSGYIGFDLIAPSNSTDDVILVEINPRLTTSYLGYRRLTGTNLAKRILFPARNRDSILWKTETIRFSPDGLVSAG